MMKKTKVDLISICIIILFSILSVKAYQGDFNTKYNFTGWSVDGPIALDHEPALPWGSQTIEFVTTSMSAHNPIKIIATIDLDERTISSHFKENYLEGESKLFLILPLSYPAYPKVPESERATPFISLLPTDIPNQLKGERNITYPFAGNYDYVFMTTEDMKRFEYEDKTGFSLSAVDSRRINGTIIIESSELTSNLQTNNIFLTLTLVAIAFGSIEILQTRFKS